MQIYCCKSKDTIYNGYLCESNWDKNSISLQPEETISFMWLGKQDFLKFIESEKYIRS